MCVFVAFSDSAANWGGGAFNEDPPGDPTTLPDGVMSYRHACDVFALTTQRSPLVPAGPG